MTAPAPRASRAAAAGRRRRSDACRRRAATAPAGVAEQRTVGDVDREGPARRHRRAAPLVARQHLRRAGILAAAIACPTISAISAASRSPILSLARRSAESTWAASPTSAMRFLANCRGRSIASGNTMAAGLDAPRGRESNAIASRRLRTTRRRSSAISRSASFGAATQTTLQRLPGSGTNTQGPSGV